MLRIALLYHVQAVLVLKESRYPVTSLYLLQIPLHDNGVNGDIREQSQQKQNGVGWLQK